MTPTKRKSPTKSPPSYLWVNIEGDPDKVAKDKLPTVRKHVMEHFLGQHEGGDPRRHRRSLDPANNIVKYDAASPAKHPPTRVSTANAQCSSERVQPVRSSPPSLSESLSSFPVEYVKSEQWQPYLANPLSSLCCQEIDPFDSLPATISKQELLWWHDYRVAVSPVNWELGIPWLQDLDNIYTRGLWDIAKDNIGLFHLILCIGQARRSMVLGEHHDNTQLFHHTKAISFINERLSAHDIDEPLLMTMSSLARMNLADEEPESAVGSMKAIQHVLGPKLAASRRLEWRVIIWTDLRLASTLLQAPYLPYCGRREDPQAYLPIAFHENACNLTAETMKTIPSSMPQETKRLFYWLHMESMVLTSGNNLPVPREMLLWVMQDMPYQTVYRLCALVVDRAKGNFDISFAVLLAMRLYAWVCAPEYIPEQAQVKVCYGPFIKRISEQALNKLYKGLSSVGPLDQWWRSQGGDGLESLLWTLFIAWSTANIGCFNLRRKWMPPSHVAGWFLDKLKDVALDMGLERERDFEAALQKLPWVKHFCVENCRDAWESMGIVADNFSADEFLNDEYEL